MSEIWKSSHFSKQYEISNLGRIRYVKTGTIRQTRVKHGKKYINVNVNGEDVPLTMSKLVLSAFRRLPILNEHSNHINGDRMDDRIENLEWTTSSSRIYFSRRIKSGCPIKVVYQDGRESVDFVSISSASDELQIRPELISSRIGKGFVDDISIEENPIFPDSCSEIRSLQFGDKNVYISSDGMVKVENSAWKNPSTFDNGYIRTTLPFDEDGNKHEKGKNYYMHRLMTRAFHGDTPFSDYTDVHHIDEDKSNNHPSNLQWVTRKTNMLLTYGLGYSNATGKKKIYKYKIGGEYTGESFESVAFAAKSIGLTSLTTISGCINGKRPQSGNFEWSIFGPEEYKGRREGIMKMVKAHQNKEKEDRDAKKGPKKETGKKVFAYKDGTFFGEYKSGAVAGEATGCSPGNISKCISGKLEQTCGFTFSRTKTSEEECTEESSNKNSEEECTGESMNKKMRVE